MNPITPTDIMRSPEVRRRGFVTLVTLLGIGALLAMLALSTATVPTTVTMAPASAPESSGSAASAGTSHATSSAVEPTAAEAGATTAAGSSSAGTKEAATEPTHPTTPAPATACGGLQAAVDAFMQHLNAAHLETSPGQQVADVLNVDQYVNTHTVLIENMIKPALGGATSALDTFLQHVYAAHLEASPGQQAADALAVDQYIKTHTVMVENMLKPLAGTDVSSC